MQEFAFRGHDERESSINKGNYKEVAEVNYALWCFTCWTYQTLDFSGMSKTILNDLIASIASSIKS